MNGLFLAGGGLLMILAMAAPAQGKGPLLLASIACFAISLVIRTVNRKKGK